MTAPLTLPGFVSPSLVVAGDETPAYELKFLLDEAVARQVEDWARRHLAPDPHGDPALGGAYRTISLYCDTEALDVYHGRPGYRRRKFRLRRYGAMPWAFLERKARKGDRVAKRRTAVPLTDLGLLTLPTSPLTWSGHWFHRSLTDRLLAPACRVAYERTAYLGAGADGPVRLTLDYNLRGELVSALDLGPVEGPRPLLTGPRLVELKFRSALPAACRELVGDLKLVPARVSKYKLCRLAWGAPAQEAADA